MFVCLCKSVTDHQINEAVDQGVASFAAMQEHLEVATGCGTCSCHVKEIIEAKLNKALSSRGQIVPQLSTELHY